MPTHLVCDGGRRRGSTDKAALARTHRGVVVCAAPAPVTTHVARIEVRGWEHRQHAPIVQLHIHCGVTAVERLRRVHAPRRREPTHAVCSLVPGSGLDVGDVRASCGRSEQRTARITPSSCSSRAAEALTVARTQNSSVGASAGLSPGQFTACRALRKGRKAAECMYMNVVPESRIVLVGGWLGESPCAP